MNPGSATRLGLHVPQGTTFQLVSDEKDVYLHKTL